SGLTVTMGTFVSTGSVMEISDCRDSSSVLSPVVTQYCAFPISGFTTGGLYFGSSSSQPARFKLNPATAMTQTTQTKHALFPTAITLLMLFNNDCRYRMRKTCHRR